MQPLILLNTVGLTSRHLQHTTRLRGFASYWSRPLQEALPAVTCTAQATMLTGKSPQEHGIVGNGWLYRDTMEVRFWQQSNRLLQAEPVYATARRRAAERGRTFRCAKIFWWFNQGAAVDISVTPKPHYGADGNKAFDVLGYPEGLAESVKRKIGPFPFPSFWGPKAGIQSTQWIARCAAEIARGHLPDLTLVYLPHLDYDTQKLGPERCDWPKLVGELDAACEPLLDAARAAGARVWVTNEYAHVPVDRPILINRALRQAGLLQVRDGPFGEVLDTFESQAFAVCDHQIAHVYLKDEKDGQRVADAIRQLPGVSHVYGGAEREEIHLNHARAGELIALSASNAWFAYPYWLDDRRAPDFARTVDIHRKPGYDPCELFLDPKLFWPMGRILRKLVCKKLGFRTLFDVIPLDPTLVRGSHGLALERPEDKPVLLCDARAPHASTLDQTELAGLILGHFELQQ
ncbi:MAG: alkaline phosphatase family protein [Gemmataceae bacterium]|nr:alkaline phosphatase family protein [Gemmataceae bacterium]MCI0742773.1 alkaline phosphatase family protein [Gemmataceae bacterium]